MASKLGEAYVTISGRLKPLHKSYTKARSMTVSAVRGMTGIVWSGVIKIFRMVSQVLKRLAQVVAAGLIGMVSYFTILGARYEQSMARVQALTGATEQSFLRLNATAMRLGATTQFTASQAAKGMSYLALAGFDTEKILAAMPHALNLAAAGQIELADATNITAKIMAGMGLTADEMEHAVDVLAKAFTTANTDLSQLGEALKFVGPVGRAAGKSLEELTAVIQVLSNAGIQSTMAGTSLRGIIAKLSGATPAATKIFKKLGVTIKDSSGKMRPLADIVDNLRHSMRNLDEVEQTEQIMRAFGLRAGPAMAALLSEGGDAIRRYEEALADAGGTAQRIADIQMNTLKGSWIKLKSVLETLGIEMSKTWGPSLRALVDTAAEWIRYYKDRFVESAGIIVQKIQYLSYRIFQFLGAEGTWKEKLGAVWEYLKQAAAVAFKAIIDMAALAGVAIADALWQGVRGKVWDAIKDAAIFAAKGPVAIPAYVLRKTIGQAEESIDQLRGVEVGPGDTVGDKALKAMLGVLEKSAEELKNINLKLNPKPVGAID